MRKAQAQQSVAVAIRGVSKTFNPRSRVPVHALRDVSFSVNMGEIVGLIGPNGAGKTTLLRILLGYLRADNGEISLLGEHPESLAVRQHIGYQADSQFRSNRLTVAQFLGFHQELLRLPDSRQIDELLRQFSLTEVRHRKLSALSKGMRQKVELALAFLGKPQVVFLDEPTASLDPPSIFELREFLAKRKKMKTGVFFSSHNLTEVEQVCDRVLFIGNGSILAEYAMRDRKRGFLERAFRKHLVEKT